MRKLFFVIWIFAILTRFGASLSALPLDILGTVDFVENFLLHFGHCISHIEYYCFEFYICCDTVYLFCISLYEQYTVIF